MDKRILLVAAILGVTAMILGAFGAHALKKVLSVEQLATFEVGVRYQMYHALFLLFVGTFAFLGEKERSIIGFVNSVLSFQFSFWRWSKFWLIVACDSSA